MADQQITQLPEETGTVASTFPLAIVNTTAAETRKITTANLATAIFSNLSAGGLAASKVGTGYSGASLTDGTVTNAKLVSSSINFGGVSVALGAQDLTPSFNLQDATGYPCSALTGTITNAQLAGSIAVSKLASNSVSFGGISVSLGSSSAKPAFDLENATAYKTTNLVGTITNQQLAGSIENSKLLNSSVSFGGISLALGASDPHPAFDLQDSTGYKTTNLVGTITNAQLAGSIEASKLVANSLTTDQLGPNCVGSSELANNAVDSGAVASGAITNDKVETSSSSTTGLDGATKLRDGSVSASKLNASTVGNGLAINSNVLSINNTITGATSLGLTFSNQGICTGIAALQASDLSGVLATASTVGVVKVPSSGGLSVSGSGDLSLASTVTAHTTRGIAVNAYGQVTSVSATVPSSALPVASTTAIGAIKVPSTSAPLTVDGNGILTIGVSGVTAGTGFTKFNVNDKGLVTSAGAITAAEIPNISAALLTSGTLNISRIANNAIGGALLSDASTTLFGGPGSTSNIVTFPSASFKGQRFWDEYHGDEYIWTGSSWQAVTITGGELIYGGTYNAASGQNKVASVTTAGAAAGLQTGSGLPTPSATNIRVYVVVSDSGTGTGNAPNVALAPPDMLVSNGTNSWDLVDVSNAIAGQTASNISFTPYQNLASTNAQAVIQELDDEKVGKAGINVITGTLEMGTTGVLRFEGSTANSYKTTLENIDPLTASRVLKLPDNDGNLVSTGSTGVVTSAMIDASLANSNIAANAAIALSKLAAVSAGQILVGASGTGTITAVTPTGDIALTSAGAFSYVAGSISNTDINASAGISASKIDVASTSQAGCVQLSSATTSTSATKAATPAAVKIAKDAADAAQTTANAALATTGGVLTGHLTLDDEKELRFREEDAGGDHYIALKAAASLAADVTLTLPNVAPAANQILVANASTPTTLEWAANTSATALQLAGGTMQGAINMGANNITNGGTITGTFVGNVTGNISGTSGGFTAGSASNLDSGTVATARLGSGTASSSNFLRGDNTWQTIDLTALSASNLTSGTVPDARFPATLPAASGANLTALNASNISSGTIAAARVPTLNQNTTGTAATVTGAAQSAITSLGTLTGLTVDGDVTIADKIIHSGDTNTAIRFPAADTFSIETGGSERARVDSSGRLLLGTAASRDNDVSFQIEGLGYQSATMQITRNSANADSGGIYLLKTRGTADGQSTVVQSGDQLGYILFRGADGTDGNSTAASIEGFCDGTPGSNDMPGRLVFSTTADGASSSTERMRIDSSGNVGIGTTSPASVLDIVHTTVSQTPGSNDIAVLRKTGEGYLKILSNTAGTGGIAFGDTDDTFIGAVRYDHNDDALELYVNNAERFRIGSAGQLGIGGATYGTSGQVLTSGGSGAAPSWADAGGGGSEVSSTATGAITADKAVCVKSDGTFEQVAATSSLNNPVTVGSTTYQMHDSMPYDNRMQTAIDSSGYIAMTFQAESTQAYYKLGKVDTSDGSIDWYRTSYGNAWFNSTTTYYQRVTYGKNSAGEDIFLFSCINNGGEIVFRAAKVESSAVNDNGTLAYNLTFGNQQAFTGTADHYEVAFNDTDDKFYVVYSGAGNSAGSGSNDKQIIVPVSVSSASGFAVTTGTKVGGTISGSGGNSIKTVIDPSTKNIFSFIQKSNIVKIIPWTWGGSAYTMGSMSDVVSGIYSAGYRSFDVGFDSKNSKIILTYMNSDEDARVMIGDVSGASVTWGSYIEYINADSLGSAITFDTNLNRVFIGARHGTTSSSTTKMRLFSGVTSGSGTDSTITFTSSSYLVNDPATNFCAAAFDPSSNLVIFSYGDSADADRGKIITVDLGSVTTNATTENFIGFAKSTVSNGATATVKVVGNTTTQSSLTPGQKYYLQMDGTIGLTSASAISGINGVITGRALTSTSLLIAYA